VEGKGFGEKEGGALLDFEGGQSSFKKGGGDVHSSQGWTENGKVCDIRQGGEIWRVDEGALRRGSAKSGGGGET